MTEDRTPEGVVRAAGGVVWRRGEGGDVEVVLVHRPKYDDWSLPKGKCEEGEADAACALREVEEETGYRCALGPELGEVDYVDHQGRPKRVRYWTMSVVGGALGPTLEIDEARWVAVPDATGLLTYPRDVEVLDRFRPA